MDLRSNESRDYYHEDGYLVPSPRHRFRFEIFSRLNLTLSVYLGNATFPQFLPFAHLIFDLDCTYVLECRCYILINNDKIYIFGRLLCYAETSPLLMSSLFTAAIFIDDVQILM